MNSGATSTQQVIDTYRKVGGVPVVVATTPGTVLVAGAASASGITTVIKSLWVGNVHASTAATLTLYLIATGGTPGASSQMGGAVSYAVGSLVEELNGGEIVLPAGYDLVGIASASSSIHTTASVQYER